jgi:hypothetical protein
MTYREVGERLGIRETDVRNYLTFCRGRFREILETRVKETSATPEGAPGEQGSAGGKPD